MDIILRKVRGVLQAMLRSPSLSFGSGYAPFSANGFLGAFASAFAMKMAFVLLAVIAMLATVTTAHAVPVPMDPNSMMTLPLIAGAGITAIKEKQEKIVEKGKHLEQAFAHAGDNLDFSKPEVLKHLGVTDSAGAVAKVKELNKELEDLGKERDSLVEMDSIQRGIKERTRTPVNAVPHPDGGPQREEVKRISLGEAIVNSTAFKRYKESKSPADGMLEDLGLTEVKTLFETGAGWAPETTRTGLIVEKATRPVQLLDLVPVAKTGQAAVVYMEETTRTHSAAERAEGGNYAEDAFVLTERSETVRSIATSIPVTDEQLEDEQQASSYLNQRLMFGVRQRLDGQLLIGDGISPNLTGIKNKAGIQTQAKGTDPAPDAIFKAMTKVRVTGRAFPNAVVLHPTDWQNIRLLRTADGIYIWGNPSEAGPERIWGAQIAQCDADAAGTGYVGDFQNFCALFERKGIEVAVGYVGSQFTQGKKTIRAGLRAAFAIYRAAAFCSVTGL